MADAKLKSKKYHGLAKYTKTWPDLKSADLASLTILMSFEEAMKLSLAIQSCLLRLNKIDRRQGEGRYRGMQLALKTKTQTVMVHDTKVQED